jgi:magnesium transporter
MAVVSTLSRLFMEAHPEDAARVLEGLPAPRAAAGLGSVPSAISVPVLQRMDPVRAAGCLTEFPEETLSDLLLALPVDGLVRILRMLNDTERERLIERAPESARGSIRRILDLPEGTAGRLMDPIVTAFHEDSEAGEALRRVRREKRPGSYYVYVIDRAHKLTGVLTLRKLILAPSKNTLGSLANAPVVHLGIRDTQASVLRHPGWKSYHSLPVVSGAGLLVGVVRYEALRRLEDQLRSETSEELLSVGAALGATWVSVTAAVLDGISISVRGGRKHSSEGKLEAYHGQ